MRNVVFLMFVINLILLSDTLTSWSLQAFTALCRWYCFWVMTLCFGGLDYQCFRKPVDPCRQGTKPPVGSWPDLACTSETLSGGLPPP